MARSADKIQRAKTAHAKSFEAGFAEGAKFSRDKIVERIRRLGSQPVQTEWIAREILSGRWGV